MAVFFYNFFFVSMDILQKRLLETPAIMITTTITTNMIPITITTATSHFASCLLPADKGSSSPSRVTDRGPTEILYDIIHYIQCNGIKLKYDGIDSAFGIDSLYYGKILGYALTM